MKTRSALMALLASTVLVQVPLASAKPKAPKVPKEVMTVMQKAEPFQRAVAALTETCMPIPKPKGPPVGRDAAKNPIYVSKRVDKAVGRYNQVASACQGSIVAGCVYDATKGVPATKVVNQPLQYATKSAKCIINVNNEVRAAKMAAINAIAEAAKQAGKEIDKAGKAAVKETKKAVAETKKAGKAAVKETSKAAKTAVKETKKVVKDPKKAVKATKEAAKTTVKETKKAIKNPNKAAKKADKAVKKMFKKKKKK